MINTIPHFMWLGLGLLHNDLGILFFFVLCRIIYSSMGGSCGDRVTIGREIDPFIPKTSQFLSVISTHLIDLGSQCD